MKDPVLECWIASFVYCWEFFYHNFFFLISKAIVAKWNHSDIKPPEKKMLNWIILFFTAESIYHNYFYKNDCQDDLKKKKRSYSTLIGICFQLTWGPFKNLGEDGLVLAKYTKILTMHVFLLLKLYKAITPWLSSFLIWDNFDLFDGSIGFEFTFELWLACVEINSWYE